MSLTIKVSVMYGFMLCWLLVDEHSELIATFFSCFFLFIYGVKKKHRGN